VQAVEEKREQVAEEEPQEQSTRQVEQQGEGDHARVDRLAGHQPDQGHCEQHRHGIVASRLQLQQGAHPPLQSHPPAAQDGEDRRRIGRGDDGPQKKPLHQRDIQERLGEEAYQQGCESHAQRGQQGRRTDDAAHLAPLGIQASGEEDVGQSEDPDQVGHVGVIEVDPPDSIRARQHADPEEDQQRGDPQAIGDPVGQDAESDENPDEEDDLVCGDSVHAPSSERIFKPQRPGDTPGPERRRTDGWSCSRPRAGPETGDRAGPRAGTSRRGGRAQEGFGKGETPQRVQATRRAP